MAVQDKAKIADVVAADQARGPKLVRMVVRSGQLLIEGAIKGEGYEFDAPEEQAAGFLANGIEIKS